MKLEDKHFKFQDIKFTPVNEEQLEYMYKLTGSYEALFSKIARKYKERGLKNMNLQEDNYKDLLLGEYTFLKRPVILLNDKIFVGNSKNNIKRLVEELN